jgi:hypothetical protein
LDVMMQTGYLSERVATEAKQELAALAVALA